MSQPEALLDWLLNHDSGITRLEAMRDLGIMNLWARIADLERAPYSCVIDRERVTVPTRDKPAHVVRYTLQTKIAYG